MFVSGDGWGVGVSGQLPRVQCETFGASHLRPYHFLNLRVKEASSPVPSVCVDSRVHIGDIIHQ